jgi:cysteine desulfurase/selenocysteine lyase
MYKDRFSIFKNIDTIYLDSASSAQKPTIVLEAMDEFYTKYYANAHRSSSNMANKATLEYEETRKKVANFINANNQNEIIFTKGLTEAINFVASSFVKDNFKTVIISSLEHHSNIVPWHMQDRTPSKGLEIVNCNENLEFDYKHFESLLQNNPNAFVSIVHISNSFGVIHDIKKITSLAHKYGATVLVDGAQSTPHIPINVQELGVDFYAIAGHKMYAPMGIGILYVKEKHFKNLKIYQGGGGSIDNVSYEKTTFTKYPICYESGTPNIASVIGLSKAIDFILDISYDKIIETEKEVHNYLIKELENIKNIITYTDNTKISGSLSFNIKGIDNTDIGLLLDSQKIAIRYGAHCTKPIMDKLNISGTLRVSFAIYNDTHDIDIFIKALKKAILMLS